jgi:hypothetical protein
VYKTKVMGLYIQAGTTVSHTYLATLSKR